MAWPIAATCFSVAFLHAALICKPLFTVLVLLYLQRLWLDRQDRHESSVVIMLLCMLGIAVRIFEVLFKTGGRYGTR